MCRVSTAHFVADDKMCRDRTRTGPFPFVVHEPSLKKPLFCVFVAPQRWQIFLVPLDRYNYIFYENDNFDFHFLIVTMAMHFVHHILFNPCENSIIVKDQEELNKPPVYVIKTG